jgi:HAD superfamily hydrolase (TIGR01509 family)
MHFNKKCIIFDLDGVLLDSRANMEISWNAVCQQYSLSVPFEDYFELIGIPFQNILEKLLLNENRVAIEKTFRVTSMENIQSLQFYPGVVETLLNLEMRGFDLGVVTSKDKLRTDAILAKLACEFKSVMSPGSSYRGKPAPDHLLIVMAETGSDPIDTIYIGDMRADYQAASRAQIDYLHADWGYGELPDKECPILFEFTEILELISIKK